MNTFQFQHHACWIASSSSHRAPELAIWAVIFLCKCMPWRAVDMGVCRLEVASHVWMGVLASVIIVYPHWRARTGWRVGHSKLHSERTIRELLDYNLHIS